MKQLTPQIAALFRASERIHFDFIRHAEEQAALRKARDMRTCKRFPIGTDSRTLRVRRVQ